MQYIDNEAALIGGLISNYFFQPSVDAKLRESYLCSECVFGNTGKKACSNSTFCRGQKRAAFPKNSRKNGSKCRG